MKKYRISVAALGLLTLLSACGGSGVRETLGLNTEAPDEYAVLSRPALTVPPDFHLNAPSDNGMGDSSNVTDEAEKTLLKKRVSSTTGISKGESALLKKADAQSAKSDIRQVLYKEKRQERKDNADSTLDSLNPFDNSEKDPLVDPTEETRRVQQKKQANQPVTGDGSPTFKRSPSAPLEHLLH